MRVPINIYSIILFQDTIVFYLEKGEEKTKKFRSNSSGEFEVQQAKGK